MIWVLIGLAIALGYITIGFTYTRLTSGRMWKSVCKEYPRTDGYSEDKRARELRSLQKENTWLWPIALVVDGFVLTARLAWLKPEDLDEDLKAKARQQREKELEREAFDD